MNKKVTQYFEEKRKVDGLENSLAVKAKNWYTIQLFKETAEKRGWQYLDSFTKFTRPNFEDNDQGGRCLYFSFDFSAAKGKPAFSLSYTSGPTLEIDTSSGFDLALEAMDRLMNVGGKNSAARPIDLVDLAVLMAKMGRLAESADGQTFEAVLGYFVRAKNSLAKEEIPEFCSLACEKYEEGAPLLKALRHALYTYESVSRDDMEEEDQF